MFVKEKNFKVLLPSKFFQMEAQNLKKIKKPIKIKETFLNKRKRMKFRNENSL
jgi:hypothetical protein